MNHSPSRPERSCFRLGRDSCLAVEPLGRRLKSQFGLVVGPPGFPFNDSLRVGAGIVVDVCPRIVDLRVTPPAEMDSG
jgi:hypothetical protein